MYDRSNVVVLIYDQVIDLIMYLLNSPMVSLLLSTINYLMKGIICLKNLDLEYACIIDL